MVRILAASLILLGLVACGGGSSGASSDSAGFKSLPNDMSVGVGK